MGWGVFMIHIVRHHGHGSCKLCRDANHYDFSVMITIFHPRLRYYDQGWNNYIFLWKSNVSLTCGGNSFIYPLENLAKLLWTDHCHWQVDLASFVVALFHLIAHFYWEFILSFKLCEINQVRECCKSSTRPLLINSHQGKRKRCHLI